MFNYPIPEDPFEALGMQFRQAASRYDEHHNRIKRFFKNSKGYKVGSRAKMKSTILEDLSNITGIVHTRELLDFWCLFYYPEDFYNNFDAEFYLEDKIKNRLTDLIDMVIQIVKGSLTIDLREVVSEINMLLGSRYNFSEDVIIQASEVIRIKNEIFKKEFENTKWNKRDLESDVKKELHFFHYFRYYESILLLPRIKRDFAFEFFQNNLRIYKTLKSSSLDEAINEWVFELKSMGINLFESRWLKVSIKDDASVNRLIRCLDTFRALSIEHLLANLSLEEKIELIKDIFILRGLQVETLYLQEEEANSYILSYYNQLTPITSNKLTKEDFIFVVEDLFAKTMLAERALFSEKKPSIRNISFIEKLKLINLELGDATGIDVEFAGLPAGGKSTITELFKRLTNAYADDEIIPVLRDLAKKGIANYLDIIRFMPQEEFTIENLYELIDRYPMAMTTPGSDDPEVVAMLSQIRNTKIDSKYKIFAQDIFNQNAVFEAMILAGNTDGLLSRSVINLYTSVQYLNFLSENSEVSRKKPKLVVIFLTEIEDILNRRERGTIINPKSLEFILRQFYKLIYELTKPKLNQPPLAVLVLDCSRNTPDQNFQKIISAIQTILGENANDLMKEV